MISSRHRVRQLIDEMKGILPKLHPHNDVSILPIAVSGMPTVIYEGEHRISAHPLLGVMSVRTMSMDQNMEDRSTTPIPLLPEPLQPRRIAVNQDDVDVPRNPSARLKVLRRSRKRITRCHFQRRPLDQEKLSKDQHRGRHKDVSVLHRVRFKLRGRF